MTGEPLPKVREIISRSARWRVVEINTEECPWTPRERTLICASAIATRRMYDSPANGWQLSDAELYALHWRT